MWPTGIEFDDFSWLYAREDLIDELYSHIENEFDENFDKKEDNQNIEKQNNDTESLTDSWYYDSCERTEEIKNRPIKLKCGKYSVEVSKEGINYYITKKEEVKEELKNYTPDYIRNSSFFGGMGNQLLYCMGDCKTRITENWKEFKVSKYEFDNA